jgi:hypothetical protein
MEVRAWTKAYHQESYTDMTMNNTSNSEQNEAPPAYEAVYPDGVQIGMCTMECGSHWTKICSEEMGLCGVSVLIKAMKKMVFESMEGCKESKMIHYQESYMCCNGDLDLSFTERGTPLPPRMGSGRVITTSRQSEASEAIMAMMRSWNSTRREIYHTTYINTKCMNESMVLFGDICMSMIDELPSDLAQATDVIDDLDLNLMVCADESIFEIEG